MAYEGNMMISQEGVPSPDEIDLTSYRSYTQICDTCQQIFNAVAITLTNNEESNLRDYLQRFPHQPSREALRDSAEKGCPFCAYLDRSIDAATRPRHTLMGDVFVAAVRVWKALDIIAACAPHRQFGRQLYDHVQPFPRGQQLYLTFHTAIQRNPWNHSSYRVETLEYGNRKSNGEFDIATGNEGLPFLSNRIVSDFPPLDLADTWLTECLGSHKSCGKTTGIELPTRLIDVRPVHGSAEVKIILASDMNDTILDTPTRSHCYVALSHCWGGVVPEVILLQSNYNTLTKSIALDRLAANFQDAITVTKALGYRYLWIDSLCIIQDDKEDWQKECTRMAAVYSNAVVTIAAASSPNPDAGFLHKRSKLGENRFEFPVSLNGDFPSPVGLSKRENKDPDISILITRGWTLQESLLSSRVLTFYAENIGFACQKFRFHEASRIQYSALESQGWSHDPSWINPQRSESFPVGSRDMHAMWLLEIVTDYSRRQLSRLSDRLPAISAIAQRYQMATGDTYLAGIWREHLLVDLSWAASPEHLIKTNKSEAEIEIERSWPYKSPSWSWASCKYPVSYTQWSYSTENRDRSVDLVVEKALVTVQSAHVKQVGLNAFGEVDGGILGISCWTMTGNLRLSERRGKKELLLDESFKRPEESKRSGSIAGFYPDGDDIFDLLAKQQQQRVAVIIAPLLAFRSGYWAALVLQSVDGDTDTFRRIGMVRFSRYSREVKAMTAWIETEKPRSIQII